MRHIMLSALCLIAFTGVALAQSTQIPTNNIPEPATIAMIVAGAGLVYARARRKAK